MVQKWYSEFLKYGSRQKVTSDKSKRAATASKKPWGGRWADSIADLPRSTFEYEKRVPRRKSFSKNKLTYHYPTSYRKTWESYNK